MEKLYRLKECSNHDVNRLECIITSNLKNNDKKKAAENARDLAKLLYKKNNLVYALEKLNDAAKLHNELKLYLREYQDRIYIVEIYLEMNDIFEVANEYTKIGALCKEKLNEKRKAAMFFKEAALSFERIGNYFACHKLAYQACECSNNFDFKIQMLNMAIRSSIKQQLHTKVLFYVEEIFKYKKYESTDATYLSLCRKGYYAAKNIDDEKKVVYYLEPLLSCHINEGKEQRDIEVIGKDFLLAYIKDKRKIDEKVYWAIDSIYTDRLQKANLLNDLSIACNELGLLDDSRMLKIKSFDNMKNYYYESKKYGKGLLYSIWKLSSEYGESLLRWSTVSTVLILFFAFIYFIIGCFYPGAFGGSRNYTLLTPFYFSCVTFTTLGFGDIYPTIVIAELAVITEVILGYMMLGGVVSIFTKKLFR